MQIELGVPFPLKETKSFHVAVREAQKRKMLTMGEEALAISLGGSLSLRGATFP
jgi:hypothetical protein